jgi:hypothetical protein
MSMLHLILAQSYVWAYIPAIVWLFNTCLYVLFQGEVAINWLEICNVYTEYQLEDNIQQFIQVRALTAEL